MIDEEYYRMELLQWRHGEMLVTRVKRRVSIKDEIRKNLLSYCELDSQAMVEIHKELLK